MFVRNTALCCNLFKAFSMNDLKENINKTLYQLYFSNTGNQIDRKDTCISMYKVNFVDYAYTTSKDMESIPVGIPSRKGY